MILDIAFVYSQMGHPYLYPNVEVLPSGFEPEITALRGQYA